MNDMQHEKISYAKTVYGQEENGYPNADAIMERGVLLPLHHGMSDAMFKRLHKTIDQFIQDKCSI